MFDVVCFHENVFNILGSPTVKYRIEKNEKCDPMCGIHRFRVVVWGNDLNQCETCNPYSRYIDSML